MRFAPAQLKKGLKSQEKNAEISIKN